MVNAQWFVRSVGLGVCLASISFAVKDAAAQQIRCMCPSILAEGRGQTDCSAGEAGGMCTIDFNAFGIEVERATLQRLQEADIFINSFRFVDGQAHTAFDQFVEDMKGLATQVLVYLAVSATNRPQRMPEVLRELARTVLDEPVMTALMDAFGPEASKTRRAALGGRTLAVLGARPQPRLMYETEQVRISPGCIEVTVRDNWFMYKTIWSDAYGEPRCGGDLR